MAVTRKPVKTVEAVKTVEDFMAGSPVLAESSAMVQAMNEDGGDIKPVKMRIPAELLNQLDAERSLRKPVPSRHQFMLEALYEKISRENSVND